MLRIKLAFASLLCVGASFVSAAAITNQAKAEVPHSKIYAVYEVSFNGFELGKFKFWSNMNRTHYSMLGQAKLSVLSGVLFEWDGVTKSSGKVTSKGPRPTQFSFDYKSSKKREQINMRFTKNTVSQVIANPPRQPSKSRIPVKNGHLRNVVDPMSALMLFTAKGAQLKDGRAACNRTIPVFDGKQRFDLHFSYKRTARIPRQGTQFAGHAYVCKITYKPIAGHKPSEKGTKYMAKNKGIEVWLRPFPQANMLVPHHIVLPTPFGNALMTSRVFQMESPRHGRIAFVQ